MTEALILNCKHGNLSQITKISISVIENLLDVAEMKAHLELILKVQEKLDSLTDNYCTIVSEEDFE